MIKLDQFKVTAQQETDTFGAFQIGPLPRGYGHTLGNSLRRILLSSIPGAAVTAVKIDGVKHEYSTLDGLQEDIISILLRLKELAIKNYSEDPQIIRLKVKGKKGDLVKVTADDFELPSEVEIVDKDFELATLTKDVSLDMEITVESGEGYAYADEAKRKEIGIIPLDSVFSPVKLVRADVVPARVGQYTNLDQINIEITTNGTIKPSEALLQAANIYDEIANRLVDMLGGDSQLAQEQLKKESFEVQETEKVLVSDLNLSTRLTNALLNAGVTDLHDLSAHSRDEVANFRGMGKKSLTELDDIMAEHAVSFGK
ncbi:MAG: DNA-directed RNA polymerase subunit alpha [Candidatus Dojkabacteria bacterium]|uniref:DNA-directed RNA polymerase subunit alpha n=1 Tax=Candidatus Dojkabacteria bacterium TaxID=2099670 RepID=A0A952AGW7_9BACT|nr:DNA-directed RNA polymerase subunit alpha [Candidatus Dojkabacteria bacterium]WKZ27882.1 MAG: DNA-directed RNA polymerase subunit alpha [Candidatus Dojkabacteria bacterium]